MSASPNAAVQALRWLGRQGTRGVAVTMVVATLLPDVGALFRPFLGEVVFVLLTIAFVRLHPASLLQQLRRPGLPLAVCAWSIIAIPLLSGVLYQALAIDERAPHVYLALMLQAITAPMMSTPAIAILLGLDATVVLIVMVASTMLVPLTVVAFSQFFLGQSFASGELELVPATLGLRLLILLSCATAMAVVIRRVLGSQRIAEFKADFDGLNIIMLFIFGAAIMGSVLPALSDQPLIVLKMIVIVFAVFITLQVLSTLLFLRAGRNTAVAIGFMCSQRNLGLMLVATAGTVPEQVWLYFAVAQLPIYLGPMLMAPLVQHFVHNAVDNSR